MKPTQEEIRKLIEQNKDSDIIWLAPEGVANGFEEFAKEAGLKATVIRKEIQ